MTNQKVMTTYSHLVEEQDDGKMLQQVLQNKFRFSRKMMTRMKLSGMVTVNGESMFFTARVHKNDHIRIQIFQEEAAYILPEPVPFVVIDEDEDLLIVAKPPGVVVHPTNGYPNGTLANGVMHYWKERGETYLFRPVTRLDRDTSGLMVIAKHAYAHAFLAEQMKKKRYQRTYYAVCHHPIAQATGTIDMPIDRDPDQPMYRKVVEAGHGYPAITHYEVVEQFSSASWVRLQLETGRTHQIRVHLKAIGHPIFGDTLYGTGDDYLEINRQALHATSLKLFHPRLRTWKEWSMPLPEDMKQLVSQLRSNDHV
ncbi:RluA family pseudouridine synthase [Hazenella sp. IB182357]|uniref:Pseudouridine synthase n=1 Tax=Polycladospora coralii TaxID=2771432 RepID=A0A926N768_9BACL|nr:RluA family pseudouridine synthase [Polycladospora coralii]MBD1370792.1 RluA family pseudouridine synthase [Polycladospora coralii]